MKFLKLFAAVTTTLFFVCDDSFGYWCAEGHASADCGAMGAQGTAVCYYGECNCPTGSYGDGYNNCDTCPSGYPESDYNANASYQDCYTSYGFRQDITYLDGNPCKLVNVYGRTYANGTFVQTSSSTPSCILSGWSLSGTTCRYTCSSSNCGSEQGPDTIGKYKECEIGGQTLSC